MSALIEELLGTVSSILYIPIPVVPMFPEQQFSTRMFGYVCIINCDQWLYDNNKMCVVCK